MAAATHLAPYTHLLLGDGPVSAMLVRWMIHIESWVRSLVGPLVPTLRSWVAGWQQHQHQQVTAAAPNAEDAAVPAATASAECEQQMQLRQWKRSRYTRQSRPLVSLQLEPKRQQQLLRQQQRLEGRQRQQQRQQHERHSHHHHQGPQQQPQRRRYALM